MPQQQRKPSFLELLEQESGPRPAPSPTPAAAPAPSFLELLEQEQQVAQQPQQESTYQWLKRNVGLGIEQAGQALNDAGYAVYEAGRKGLKGNFQPLREVGEGVARGTALVNANPVAALNTTVAIEQAKQRTQQRRVAAGDIYALGSQVQNAKLEAEAAKDPALSSRVVRGVVSGAIQALPAIGASVLGGAPAGAIAGGLLSFDNPADLPQNVALGALPAPARKAASGAVERVLGRGVAQIAEAEARAAAPAAGRIVTGAVENQAAIRAASLPSQCALVKKICDINGG